MALDNLRNDIANLSSFDWGKELENIVETNKDAIIQLQQEQWSEGKDSLGNAITLDGRGYSKKTFEIKTKKGQRTDVVTLQDTGKRMAALEVTVQNGTFSETDNVEYESELIERTGEVVYGLDEEKRQQFADNITLPAIRQIYNEKTGFIIP